MSQGYVRGDGFWAPITGVAYYDGTAWQTQDGQAWYNGSWDVISTNMIEDFEGSTYVGDHFRGSESGNSFIIPDAALVDQSSQGFHCDGFVERYTLPGDNANPLYQGVECSFYFYPRKLESQAHFLLAPQENYASPPDGCYRLELHLGQDGSRLVKMSLSDPSNPDSSITRNILDSENSTVWEEKLYKCRLIGDSSGTTFTIDEANLTLSGSDTEYIENPMGFGFRCGSSGMVDYDWLGYE